MFVIDYLEKFQVKFCFCSAPNFVATLSEPHNVITYSDISNNRIVLNNRTGWQIFQKE